MAYLKKSQLETLTAMCKMIVCEPDLARNSDPGKDMLVRNAGESCGEAERNQANLTVDFFWDRWVVLSY